MIALEDHDCGAGQVLTRRYRPRTGRQKKILASLIKLLFLSSKTEGLELTTGQLCAAIHWTMYELALQEASTTEIAPITESELRNIGGPLVRSTPDGEGLEFTHPVYFNIANEHQKSIDSSDSPHIPCLELLAKACFSELLSPDHQLMPTTIERDLPSLVSRDQRYPFYRYAATH